MVSQVTRREHFCGAPQRLKSSGSIPRWEQPNWDGTRWIGPASARVLTYNVDSVTQDWWPSIAWAWNQWALVCAIHPTRVSGRPADVNYEAGRIDGPSSTLAFAELPVGPDRPLRCVIDIDEPWFLLDAGQTLTRRPQVPRQLVDLGGVICHEIGHNLGLEHDETDARSLLDPTYGDDVLTPQEWDIAQAILRYGPPVGKPGADGKIPPQGRGRVEVVLPDGSVWRGSLDPSPTA